MLALYGLKIENIVAYFSVIVIFGVFCEVGVDY